MQAADEESWALVPVYMINRDGLAYVKPVDRLTPARNADTILRILVKHVQ